MLALYLPFALMTGLPVDMVVSLALAYAMNGNPSFRDAIDPSTRTVISLENKLLGLHNKLGRLVLDKDTTRGGPVEDQLQEMNAERVNRYQNHGIDPEQQRYAAQGNYMRAPGQFGNPQPFAYNSPGYTFQGAGVSIGGSPVHDRPQQADSARQSIPTNGYPRPPV